MKRYKKKYSSNLQLTKAFATRSLDPAGDRFESRQAIATHQTLRHLEIGTIAVWHGDQMFRTEWGRTNSGMSMLRNVGWEHRKHFERLTQSFGPNDPKPVPRFIKIPRLAFTDTLPDMRRKLLDEARRWFNAAKRARGHAAGRYDGATLFFNRAVEFSEKFNLPLPTASEIPEDFDSWWVVFTFKIKADLGRTPVRHHTLHPCYTATLQPDHAVAA